MTNKEKLNLVFSKTIISCYSHIWENEWDIIALNGGRNSGKSRSVAIFLVFSMLLEDYFRFIVFREFAKDLKDSVLAEINSVIDEKKLADYFIISREAIVCKFNGNKVLAKSLGINIKSISGITGCVFEEEIPENEEDFFKIILSMRVKNISPRVIIVTNNNFKNFKNHWYYLKFYKDLKDIFNYNFIKKIDIEDKVLEKKYKYTFISLHTTVDDNIFANSKDRALLHSYKDNNEYLYLTAYKGYFAEREMPDLMFHKFSINKHFVKCNYDNNRPILFSFDFNRTPYCTCLCFQVLDGKAKLFDFIKDNLTVNLVKKVSEKYKNNILSFVTGDASGVKEQSNYELSDWDIIKKNLRFSGRIDYVYPKANPSVAITAEFVNICFENNRIFVDEDLGDVLFELKNLRQNSMGEKLIEKKNGIEITGHIGDCLRYAIVYIFKDLYLGFKNGTGGRNTIEIVR